MTARPYSFPELWDFPFPDLDLLLVPFVFEFSTGAAGATCEYLHFSPAVQLPFKKKMQGFCEALELFSVFGFGLSLLFPFPFGLLVF